MAGRFYEGRADRLRAELAACFAGARGPDLREAPVALVAPHAGLAFSGQVAASAWRAAGTGPRPRRVVLLGPAHHMPVRGIGTSSAARFDTPLGPLALDRPAIRAVEALPFAAARDDAHAPEHCLEVQLPFLLHVFGPVPVVPLLVGEASPAEVAAAIRAAGGCREGGVLTVVSTDLSHFLPDGTARRRDRATCRAIQGLDDGAIGPEDACGHRALRGLLRLAREAELRALPLDVRTSADAGGSPGRVVGYAAFAFVRRAPTCEDPG